jgi:hypothetical protein
MKDFWKRKVNLKEPEVIKTVWCSVLFIVFLLLIDFHSVLLLNIESIKSLLLTLIGGLIGLLGVSIAGMAIALSMFTSKEIRTINDLQDNSFPEILKTFSHFAYDIVLCIIIFVGIFLLLLTNFPSPPVPIFYVVTFIISYYLLYILFYGWALLGNYVSLSCLRDTIGKIEATEKSKFDSFNELGLEQLVEIIYRSSGQESKSFYRVLLQTVKNSSISQKEELIEYIEKRYL